ncbi:MAG: signal peptidase II, partial [bacterium]|nr:signal peptidase II [bacterium]
VDPGLIALAIHKNYGIAFDIPFKLEIVILISVFIGIGLIQVAYKQWRDKPAIAFSALMIVIGALGNLYDRIVYDFTVDYIILFGTSAINLSDLVIVGGAILLLLTSREKKVRRKKVDTSSDA